MISHDLKHVVVLEPRGHLCEGAECDEMERTLVGMAEQGRRVVVDLSGTDQLTARGLGILAHAHKIALGSGGRIVLCGANRVERWLLTRTRLAEALVLYESRASAVSDLARTLHEPAPANAI